MKYLSIFILFLALTRSAQAGSLDEIYEWLNGTWQEVVGHCPVTLIFEGQRQIKIISENSEASGIYKISKAVGIPAISICRDRACYEMEWDIYVSEYSEGCFIEIEPGLHQAYLNNFYKKNQDVLVWGEDIVFHRVK
jgi:hypothetical protein